MRSAALALQGELETSPDGFLQNLDLDAAIDGPADEKVILLVPGGQTTVDSARLSLAFGEAAGENWNGTLDIAGLATRRPSRRTLRA